MRSGEATLDQRLLDRDRIIPASEEEFKILTPAEGQLQGIQSEEPRHLPCERIHTRATFRSRGRPLVPIPRPTESFVPVASPFSRLSIDSY